MSVQTVSPPLPLVARAKLLGQLTVRMDEALFHDVGVTAYRLGIERSEVVRKAATIFAQAVEDAWYLAQIGAEPSPTADKLVAKMRSVMAAEVASGLLLIQSGNRAADRLAEDFSA